MCVKHFKYCFVQYSWPPIITPFSEASSLPPQLADNHNRPMGTWSGSGIPVRVNGCAAPDWGTLSTDQSPATAGSSGRGSAETSDQGCYSESGAMPRTIPQQAVLSEEEGWIISPSGESSEAFEPAHCQVPLQNGRNQHGEGSSTEERLDGFRRPEGCQPFSGNRSSAQEIPLLCLGRPDVRILVPPFWIQQCSEGIY